MIFGNHHPPLWLRDHPHIPAPKKVASSKEEGLLLLVLLLLKRSNLPDLRKEKPPVKTPLPMLQRKRNKLLLGPAEE